ncbi:MAG: hypothetical protein D6693_07855, partial [Planctomycetota bacterium]
MDRRHGEIVEGAGLEESKINTDFVDWLKRWGTPILFAVLALAVAYRGWTYWQEHQTRQLDSAYLDLTAAVQAANPDAIVQVAEDWSGQTAISSQARLAAADLYLLAYSRNLRPGGTPGAAEDIPTPQEREGYLAQAERLYRRVADDTEGVASRIVPHLRALSGLASVQASRGQFDEAAGILRAAATLADEASFPALAQALRDRADRLEAGLPPITFPKADELPAPPAPEPADSGEFLTPEELLNQPGSQIGPVAPEETTPATEPPAGPAGPDQEPPVEPAPEAPARSNP